MPFESKIPFFIFFRRTLSGAVGLLIYYIFFLLIFRFIFASMLNLDIIFTLLFILYFIFYYYILFFEKNIHTVTSHPTDEVDIVWLA